MIKTNFFTICNGIYKEFIPLFILSHLYHNENCFVEIGVDTMLKPEILKSLRVINKYFPDKFSINVVNFGPIKLNDVNYQSIPNTVRFFTTPKTKSEYVYISDIDIICLQKELTDIHINNMIKTGLPYSNIVRPKKDELYPYQKLSGLHFTKYENYYPIPSHDDLIKKGLLKLDESFLYELVKKKYPDFNLEETFRPVHGIHVSPNREPIGKVSWNMNGWKNQWNEFRNTKEFKDLEPTLTKMIKEKIQIIENFYIDNNG
jgi:hypothetical protein